MSEIIHVDKGWGHEKWIVNKAEYCGKLLFFKKGKMCSLHYHKLKDEVFYVQSGRIRVMWSDDTAGVQGSVDGDSFPCLNVVDLKPGENFHVPPGRVHQMIAFEDTELFEFSTQHFDSDSYRIVKGD